MTEYAPQTLRDLYSRIKFASRELSGIVGNTAHTYGYHRSRNVLLAAGRFSDYSVTLTADKTGDGDAACALDVKLSAADMITASKRLMAACRNHDPRVDDLREWFGTEDGQRVTGWDRHDPATFGDDSFTTSDGTHLWHIHLSIYRGRIGSATVLRIADVINGVPLAGPYLRRAWPVWMKPGSYFGLITGGPLSIGGYYVGHERDTVTLIQQRLIATKTVTGVGAAWADGRFEKPTEDGVKAWQRAHHLTVDGRVGPATWRSLFTY